MFKVASALTALFLSSASAVSIGQRGDGVAIRGLLAARQINTPDIPSGGDQCDSQCETASNEFGCGDESCICTSSHLQDLADCYSCLTPYIQNDPTWVSDAQTALGYIVQGCQELGYTVSTPTFDGSSVPSPSTDGGSDTFPTDGFSFTDTESSPTSTGSTGSSPTESTGSSASPAATSKAPSSSSPATPGVKTGAASSFSVSAVVFISAVGAAMMTFF